MRIKFRYGAVVGILAAAFSTLGPVAVQAGQTPGTPVPTRAGAISVQAPAAHLLSITSNSIVLSSTFERSAWRHDNGTAQREGNNVGLGRDQLGLPGQQDRMVVKSYRCSDWGSWRYPYCTYPDHHNCWWRWGWYDHYGHYHSGWHWYCRHHDHYNHYNNNGM
jgi:hypothetical protein